MSIRSCRFFDLFAGEVSDFVAEFFGGIGSPLSFFQVPVAFLYPFGMFPAAEGLTQGHVQAWRFAGVGATRFAYFYASISLV